MQTAQFTMNKVEVEGYNGLWTAFQMPGLRGDTMDSHGLQYKYLDLSH